MTCLKHSSVLPTVMTAAGGCRPRGPISVGVRRILRDEVSHIRWVLDVGLGLHERDSRWVLEDASIGICRGPGTLTSYIADTSGHHAPSTTPTTSSESSTAPHADFNEQK